MRVLLDENLPLELAAEILGHEATTVRANGWAGLKNGELMKRAATSCDVFLTMDRNIQHQQHIASLPFGVILLGARSNRLEHLRPLVPKLLQGIADDRQIYSDEVDSRARGRRVRQRLPLAALAVALALTPSRSDAQRPRRAPDPYVGPVIAPWIGVELGGAVPVASCIDCDLWYGGSALMTAYGVGVTIRSRLRLGLEEMGMTVLVADSPSNSRLQLFTVRVPLIRDFMIKGGIRKGRYLLGDSRLVDSRLTGLIGVDQCIPLRAELCLFVDYSQSARSDYGAEQYYLGALRGGMGIRLNLLPGKSRGTSGPSRGRPRG